MAEDDLFSDRMDTAVSTFTSVRHGIIKNAEQAGEEVDGETMMRRAIAAAIDAYNQQ